MDDFVEQSSTKDRIIAAAEALFSEIGFNGTSMRAITRQAEVSLALVNYHFGSKELLLKAVIERHILPVNAARRERLDLLEARYRNEPPPIEDVVRAVVEPFVQNVTEVDRFMRACMVVKHIKKPSLFWKEFWGENFNDIVQRSMALLSRALPDVPNDVLAWRVHFMSSCLYDGLGRMDRMEIIAVGAGEVFSPERFLDEMVAFVVAGFKGCQTAKACP